MKDYTIRQTMLAILMYKALAERAEDIGQFKKAAEYHRIVEGLEMKLEELRCKN